MACEKIVINPDRVLGGKAGLLTEAAETGRENAAMVQGKPQADRNRAAKVQGKPRADRASVAKVIAKPAPATKS